MVRKIWTHTPCMGRPVASLALFSLSLARCLCLWSFSLCLFCLFPSPSQSRISHPFIHGTQLEPVYRCSQPLNPDILPTHHPRLSWLWIAALPNIIHNFCPRLPPSKLLHSCPARSRTRNVPCTQAHYRLANIYSFLDQLQTAKQHTPSRHME